MLLKTNSLISDWMIFTRVVECRSFSAAAREVNRSVSAFSKSVIKLENILNAQLLSRSAHSFDITPAGHATYEKAKLICRHYNDLVAELNEHDSSIQGVLRLAAPTVMCESLIPRWVMAYTRKHPGAVIYILSREGGSFSSNSPEFDDLVIKSGYINSPDLIHKKINQVPFGLFASPEYLSSVQNPAHPEELINAHILKLMHPSLAGEIKFTSAQGDKTVSVNTSPVFSSNNIGSLINMAIEGQGICMALPTWSVQQHVDAGKLVAVLPEWNLPALPAYLVWRYRTSYTPLFRSFIDFLENQWNDFF
ncbi:DNA-binding transcriptional LysR family regulator [Kluyvera sp. 1366]